MDRDDPVNCRPLTEKEVEEELRFALHMTVSNVKVGRVTFREAIERGFPLLAEKLTRCLSPHIMFLKKPPSQGHSIPGGDNRK